MDRYTPCVSRPTEVYARRKKNVDYRRDSYPEDVLHHLSGFLEYQEFRITQLMRNFDMDLEDASYDRMGITDPDTITYSSHLGNIAPLRFPKFPPVPKSEKPRSIQPSAFSRPGRLSPTIIQMILSSNTSTVSGFSSAADTSYDSGLYQWLGVEMDTRVPGSSGNLAMSNEPSDDSANLDISMMSSHSAYSHPLHDARIVFPLSPPATAVPPFSNTLRGEPPGDPLECTPDLSPHHPVFTESNQIFNMCDSATPALSNNISLQHFMPSASVLRHFQEVIDELRGLYVPNETANNVPNPDRARAFLSPRLSLPGSHMMSPSHVSRRRSSHNLPESITQAQNSTVGSALKMDNNNMYRDSRATRELYTEMAAMLFTQVSNEEAQVKNLRDLVNRLEVLAIRKRKVALVIGTWGRD